MALINARTPGVLLALALAAAPALAQTQAPVQTMPSPVPGQDVASVHAWLRDHNPELQALQLEVEAARARILPAGALPDPSASITLGGLEPGHPWQASEMGRESSYSLRQRFPLWGKRRLARTVARQQAEAVDLDRDIVVRELLAEAEAAYVRYWHADAAVAVIDRRLALLRQVEEIAGVRYALGMTVQQDSIRAQVEQTAMRRERIERLAAGQDAMAALNAVLGRAADAPLAPPREVPALPVRSASMGAVLQALQAEGHPAVRAQQARAEAARTNAQLQLRNRWPDVTLGVGAMQLGNGVDTAQLMLEVEIPLQQRARREREREARLLEEAASVRVDAARLALQRQLASGWARWTSARERRGLVETTLLPQSDAAFQSALASYQVGEVDFGTLLDALNQWQGADLDRVDTLRDELLAAAAVRAIEGDTP